MLYHAVPFITVSQSGVAIYRSRALHSKLLTKGRLAGL